jgi:peptidoglycan lytic transglycosylase G
MSVISELPSTPNGSDPRYPLDRDFGELSRSPAEALEPMRPPEPDRDDEDRRLHPILAFFNAMFQLVFFTALISFALFFFVRYQFDRPGPSAASTVVVIPKGEGTSAIAERLEHDEVISDRGLFMTGIIYFTYLKGAGSLKAGEYEFRKRASMRQVLDTLVEGKSIDHKITLPEGLTSQQIVQRINANADLKGDIVEVPAEGTLLPDTYRFQIGDSRIDIIERMQVGHQKFLAKMWAERDPDIVVKTPDEAVILASIVEKETGRADERPRIASVFENRLRKNMRLQSDPTIIYGLVGGKGVLDHPIQQDELERETPYNTYKIMGLPPTPIANPGRAAIEAVLKPAKTKDLYFVADGSGGHSFAPSLDEHNRNVVKWRQVERAMREKERAEAAAAAAAGAGGGTETPTAPAPGGEAASDQLSPEGLRDLQTSAGIAPVPGAPADAAASPAPEPFAGGDIPIPLRNPKR